MFLPTERLLIRRGSAMALTARAFTLLVALVERAGQLLTRDELMQRVWAGVVVEDNNLAVQVAALRKVLGADAITTIAGSGSLTSGATIHIHRWSAGTTSSAANGFASQSATATAHSTSSRPAAAPSPYGSLSPRARSPNLVAANGPRVASPSTARHASTAMNAI